MKNRRGNTYFKKKSYEDQNIMFMWIEIKLFTGLLSKSCGPFAPDQSLVLDGTRLMALGIHKPLLIDLSLSVSLTGHDTHQLMKFLFLLFWLQEITTRDLDLM